LTRTRARATVKPETGPRVAVPRKSQPAGRPDSRRPPSPAEVVNRVLEGYAERGVFRGFSRGPDRNRKTAFRMMWHRDRLFELVLDEQTGTLQFPLVLPQVDSKSIMYQKFKEFLKSRQSEKTPEHRRIDTRKARVRPLNRGGNLGVTLAVQDGDYEYATRKLIHLVHEIFMVFLVDGPYYQYMVEQLGLDPDAV